MKVTPKIKAKLDAAARSSGRTQSQEAERLLEQSFGEEAAFGGPEMRGIAFSMITAFQSAGRLRSGNKPTSEWIADADCYRAAMFGVINVLLIGLPNTNSQDMATEIEGLKSKLLTRIAQSKEASDAR